MKNNEKGFSLVEMAIVLVIFGLIMSAASSILVLFVNKGGAERTRKMVESDKNALYSYVSSNKELPIKTEFLSSVTYPNDGYDKQIHYFADPILDKSNAWWKDDSAAVYDNDINTVCGSYYTNTQVWVCGNNDCSTYTPVMNVAYVVISGSENKNIQTGVDAATGKNVIRVYPQGADAIDDYTTDINRKEKYDDIVDWVTLDELRTGAGCDPEQYKFLTMTMPAVYPDKYYDFRFYIEGGVPYASDNTANAKADYYWEVEELDDSGKRITDSGTKDDMHFNVIFADDDYKQLNSGAPAMKGVYLKLNGTTTSFEADQFRIKVTVSDRAYGEDNTNGRKFSKTFILNAQQ